MKRKRSYYHCESGEETMETSVERRKKKVSWSEEAESLLIQLWEEYIDTLRGVRKNAFIFEEMANIMRNEGYDFTAADLKVKVHNLTNKYKLEKRNIEHNGGYSDWKYYNTVHYILSYKKNGEATANEDVENKVLSKEEVADDEEEEVPLGSEEQDLAEESMYSIEAIESYKPAEESKEPRRRKRDDRKGAHSSDILKMLRENTEIMRREAEERRRADAKMLRLQEELIEIERERNDILKELLR